MKFLNKLSAKIVNYLEKFPNNGKFSKYAKSFIKKINNNLEKAFGQTKNFYRTFFYKKKLKVA